jgi:hypothetical protein
MRFRQLFFASLFSCVALVATAVSAQQVSQTSPFVTAVIHHNQTIVGSHAMSVPSAAQASPFTKFGGQPWNAGPTVTPVNSTSQPEAEEHIAVDPLNSRALVAAISDFSQRGGFNTTVYTVSTDNGQSWAEHFMPEASNGLLATSDGGRWLANSDPVVAIDKAGRVYIANLYLAVDAKGNVPNDGLYVSNASLSNGGTTSIGDTRPVKTSLEPVNFIEDKPWLTVDNGNNARTVGNVYVTWTHFTPTSDAIFFSRSTDHGSTFSKAIQVSPASQNGGVQGSQVAAGPNGEIYVSWEVFFNNGQVQVWIARSINGGATFSPAYPATAPFNPLNFKATYRFNSFPAMAVNPVTGSVCILYAQQSGASSSILFTRSTASGTTFTPPVAINDSTTGQRLFPAISVDPDTGTTAASWFDTRKSPTNADRYDVYATRSTDNGGTWAPNTRVTKETINANTAVFIGDYSGIAAADGNAHPVWTDGGFGPGATPSGQLQTADLH